MPDRHTIAIEVAAELGRAQAKFEPMASPHEGWAVIHEEMDELWAHVKANTGTTEQARTEAIHVAAMAMRYVLDLCEASDEGAQEAVDLIEELVVQGCWWDGKGGKDPSPATYCDMAISTYEEACDYLAHVRPERWKREPFGLRRLGGVHPEAGG